MHTFKNHIDQVSLLESPQGKIEKYKITDPSYINFIHRFENDIKWNNVKTIDDLDAAIDEGIASVLSPENYHVPIDGINWASEKIALEGAALAGNQQAQQSLDTFNKDPEKAKKQIIDSINDGKDQVVNKWVEYLRYHDTYNLPFKYIILSSLLKKATKSRNPPVPLNQNTLARLYEKVKANPKDTFKIVDLYSSYYAQDAKAESETVPSGNGEWIKISSKANDPKNYEKNVDKLMTLACKTNWCIAQRSFASNYLSEGDFWIYFEDTPKGSIGKAAIRLSGDDTIKEIRGTLSGQELDEKYLPIVSDLVEKKSFKGKDTYLIDLLVKQKKYDKLKRLFDSGQIDANHNNGEPLYNAVLAEDITMIKLLLNYIDLNEVKYGGPIFTSAAAKGNTEIIKLLLDSGADPNEAAFFGTPLYSAVNKGRADAVKLLLKAGADPNIASSDGELDMDSYIPLTTAARRGHVEITKMLLDAGADTNADENYGGALANAIDMNEVRFMSQEGLENNAFKIIKLILKAGADPNIGNGMPLKYAVDSNNTEIAKLLLRFGAVPTATNILLKPARKGNDEMVDILLKSGVKANSANNDPLVGATHARHINVVKLLLAAGANPNLPEFNPSLLYAVQNDDLGITELLLKAGANPNIEDLWDKNGVAARDRDSRQIPLNIAISTFRNKHYASNSTYKIIQLLLQHGADATSTAVSAASFGLYKDKSKDGTKLLELLQKYSGEQSPKPDTPTEPAPEPTYPSLESTYNSIINDLLNG